MLSEKEVERGGGKEGKRQTDGVLCSQRCASGVGVFIDVLREYELHMLSEDLFSSQPLKTVGGFGYLVLGQED